MSLQEIASIYTRIKNHSVNKESQQFAPNFVQTRLYEGEKRIYVELNGLTKEEVEQLVIATGEQAYRSGYTHSQQLENGYYRYSYALAETEDYTVDNAHKTVLTTLKTIDQTKTEEEQAIIQRNQAILQGFEEVIVQNGLLEAVNEIVGVSQEDERYILNRLRDKYVEGERYKTTIIIQLNHIYQQYKQNRFETEDITEIVYNQLPYPSSPSSQLLNRPTQYVEQSRNTQVQVKSTYLLPIPEKVGTQWLEVLEDYNQQVVSLEAGQEQAEYTAHYVRQKVKQLLMGIMEVSNDLPQHTQEQMQCVDSVTDLILDLV